MATDTPLVDWELNKGDTGKPMTGTLANADGTPIDLTGSTVTLTLTRKATGVVKVNAAAVTVTNATTGRFSYGWQAADVDTVGLYEGRFAISLPSGRRITVPTNTEEPYFTVRVNP